MLIGTKVKEIAKKKGISLNQLEKDTKIAQAVFQNGTRLVHRLKRCAT